MARSASPDAIWKGRLAEDCESGVFGVKGWEERVRRERGEEKETNLSSGCYGVVRVGGGVGDGVWPDVCDNGDTRVILEVLEDGGFIGEACFVAAEDDAEWSGGGCDCFDNHVGGLLDM